MLPLCCATEYMPHCLTRGLNSNVLLSSGGRHELLHHFFMCHSTHYFSKKRNNEYSDSSEHIFTFTFISPSALWIYSFYESRATPTHSASISCKAKMICGSDKQGVISEMLRTAFYVFCIYCPLLRNISRRRKCSSS